MSLCSGCDKRSVCVELCPEAEVYASEDQVEWGQTPVTYTDPDRNELMVFDPVKGTDKPVLSKMEKAVLLRLGEGKTREDIANELGITRVYVRNLCQRIRDKRNALSL